MGRVVSHPLPIEVERLCQQLQALQARIGGQATAIAVDPLGGEPRHEMRDRCARAPGSLRPCMRAQGSDSRAELVRDVDRPWGLAFLTYAKDPRGWVTIKVPVVQTVWTNGDQVFRRFEAGTKVRQVSAGSPASAARWHPAPKPKETQ